MKNRVLGMLLALIFVSPLQVKALHIYQDPIPVGDYVADLDNMLDKAVARNHWFFERQGDKRFARLDYKGYKINVALLETPEGIAVSLIDANRDGCGKSQCEVDMNRVTGWLVKLRRTIAYDLTLAVRDDALRRTLD
ncbi:hypothetical protein LZP69_07555 [Shewanella sp. AS1]|uniref:hypothetical protein n=1 Tax=Shewanella sp. AS1 TaxID=2907626 RepID=UPI001F28F91D|nr:hypothetical protein [Shewanella sp. AS1]MCE9679033.1 hypothetical protein [Shewanella sp. AS1]